MSQIVTLYSDKEKTDALYPRTKVSAISDDNNTPLKELMTGMVKQEEGGTEEEVVTPINADTLGGKLTANNVVFYEEEMVDEFGQVVVKNADKLENHPASYFATSEELNTKANKSDVLSLEEIQASTDLSGKIASASALKLLNTYFDYNYTQASTLNVQSEGFRLYVSEPGIEGNPTSDDYYVVLSFTSVNNANFGIQIACSFTGNKSYIRRKWSGWEIWAQISN